VDKVSICLIILLNYVHCKTYALVCSKASYKEYAHICSERAYSTHILCWVYVIVYSASSTKTELYEVERYQRSMRRQGENINEIYGIFPEFFGARMTRHNTAIV
jgi:hypothetical protein